MHGPNTKAVLVGGFSALDNLPTLVMATDAFGAILVLKSEIRA